MRATKVVAREIDKPFTRSKAEWFIFYCLCSKMQMMINKATFMIAIPTNPKKSRYVILNNTNSTILTTPIYQSHNQKSWKQYVNIKELKVATHSAYSHFLCITLYNIFYPKTSEHSKILQLFCFGSSSNEFPIIKKKPSNGLIYWQRRCDSNT